MTSPQEDIPVANPPPPPSQLPDSVLQLTVTASKQDAHLSDRDRESLRAFHRAANYIAAGEL
jgi:xylulose-5-phosphate/fructose-6-phosphate phosphoketolase